MPERDDIGLDIGAHQEPTAGIVQLMDLIGRQDGPRTNQTIGWCHFGSNFNGIERIR